MHRMVSSRYFFSIQTKLHPYLLLGLKKNGLLPLRPSQQKAFQLFNEGNHLFVNEIDGSGKTLAYLIPVINRILFSKRQTPPKSGAIILTLNKELVLSIYKQIRMLDFDNILNVNRGGSITHYSPVVDEMCKKKQQQDEDLIMDLMYKNVAQSVMWPHTDILISTPTVLFNILSEQASNKQKISPQMVVVDEADIILNKNKELLSYMSKNYALINKLSSKQGASKHVFSAPNDSLLKSGKHPLFEDYLFKSTEYTNKESILSNITILSLKIEGNSKEEVLSNKLSKLVELIKKRENQRIVVYCSTNTIQKVKSSLRASLNIGCAEYYVKMSTQKRMAELFDFNYNRAKILLTTELANRGFSCLQPIDIIISFDGCQEREEQIIRMCHSNKEGAEYILMDGDKFNKGQESDSMMNKFFKDVKIKNGDQ